MPKEAVVSSPCFPTRLPTAVASEFDSVADEALQTLRVKPASKSVVAASFAASRDPTGQTPSTRTVPSSTGTTSSLVAKIRKQAKELSELHEELAAKEKIIQKLQQSRLHGGAAGATGQHKGKEIEEWKSKYLKEQKKYESSLKKLQEMKAVLDAKEQDKQRLVEHFKQFEDALHDLREARCRTKCGDGGPQFTTDEEKMYVRLLEEGMQVKAVEFNVGGHAELMVVLAELRHTIQGQVEKLRAKDQQILELQVEKASSIHAAQTDVDATTTSLASLAKQKEAIMDYAQSLSEKQSAVDSQNMELNDQLATLKQLHEHTEVELKSVAERYAALRESYDAAQVETTALKEKLAKVQEQCRDKDDRLASLHDEYQAKLDQCREMKLLQDDLLNSIGEAKDTERHWQDKVDVVQKQLDNALDKLATSQTETTNLAHQHAEANAVASSLKADVDSLRASVASLQQTKDQLQTECDRMREFEALVTDRAPHRKTFTAVAEAERQLRADLHLIDAFVNTSTPHGSVGLPNQHAKGGAEDYSTPSFVEWYIVGDVVSRVAMLDQRRLPPQLVHRLPRFSSYLHQVFVAVDTLIHHVSTVDTSWKRERFNLVAARDAFESSAALIQTELDMMRQWTFQLHDELQQTTRAKVEAEQQYLAATAVANEASEQVDELQQSYTTCLQSLRTAQVDIEALKLELTNADDQRQDLAVQVKDLIGRLDISKEELKDMRSKESSSQHALDATLKELAESQAKWNELTTAHGRLQADLTAAKMDLAAHTALVEECARLRQQVADHESAMATASDDNRRHLDVMQTHSKQLEAAIWDAFQAVQSHLPKSHNVKVDDAIMAVRQFPCLLDRAVQHQVKLHTHEAIKVALLQNCQTMDYQDPSLSLLRELKVDLQHLTQENQALKAQLSDCRADCMTHLYMPREVQPASLNVHSKGAPEKTAASSMTTRTSNNTDIVDALRKKLKAKAAIQPPTPSPTQHKAPGSRSHAIADDYVAITRTSTLGEQLDQLHAAFASFRTDV